MARRDVFISYSQPDHDVAHELVSQVEAHGIECWIAPRDVQGGMEWAAEIVSAIAACKVMVLIFSASANNSRQVRNEVMLALDKGVRIVPFRIADVAPSASLEYSLIGQHWLDAFPPPLDPHYAKLCTCLNNILATPTNPLPQPERTPAPRAYPRTTQVRWPLMIEAANLRRLESALAVYIGPNASYALAVARFTASNVDALLQQLGEQIESETDRRQFISGCRQWLSAPDGRTPSRPPRLPVPAIADQPQPSLPALAGTSRPERNTPTRLGLPTGALEAAPHPPPSSRIQMTVFGPAQVTRRDRIFLQTIFHVVGADDAALARARAVEPRPALADVLPLPGRISEGETIAVRLRADARVRLDECEQTLRWTGEIVVARFSVELPWLDWRSEYLFTVEVDLGGVPVGRCKFRLTVAGRGVDTEPTHAHGTLGRYRRAFVSYASEDASIVADVAQLLEIQGLEYFLDQVSLRSGCTWRTELEDNIEKSDLFLLCWSRHAAASEWVAKEIEWALQTQRRTGGMRPDIRPFILEGPPVAPPPRSLQHLHFNSATRLLKQSVAASR